jgi:hypothetical protein
MKEFPLSIAPLARPTFLLGVLFLGSGITATPAAPQLDAQDKKVTERLTWLLNKRVRKPNGDKVSIVVVPTARASEGYFSEIRMSGAPAQLKKKLRVSEFTLKATNVHLHVPSLWDGNKVKTFKSNTKLRAVISEIDFTNMLSKGKHTQAMGLKVKFLSNNTMRVSGNLNYALLSGPVEGVGKLRMASGHNVYLDILSLKLRGVEVPQFVKNQFSSRINPVINYGDLPFNPPFKGVRVVGNKAILTT